MRSKMEILRSQIDNSISSIFTKEDILTLVDKAIEEEQTSARIPITETEIDRMQAYIHQLLEQFTFEDFIEIDEDDIKLDLYEREIQVDYQGSARLGGNFESTLASDITREITDHMFEVV